MTKITEAIEMLNRFKQNGCDSADLDELESVLMQHLADNATKAMCTEGCEDAREYTNYDYIMMGMSPENLANMNVQLVLLNMDEMWWKTSTGQLFPFYHKDDAIQYELDFLMKVANPQ